MHRVRQTDTHSPQSVQGSQSLTRLGRVKISSPYGQMSLQSVHCTRWGRRFQHCLRSISGWVLFIRAFIATLVKMLMLG